MGRGQNLKYTLISKYSFNHSTASFLCKYLIIFSSTEIWKEKEDRCYGQVEKKQQHSIHFGHTYTVDMNRMVYVNVLVRGAGREKCTLSEVKYHFLEVQDISDHSSETNVKYSSSESSEKMASEVEQQLKYLLGRPDQMKCCQKEYFLNRTLCKLKYIGNLVPSYIFYILFIFY